MSDFEKATCRVILVAANRQRLEALITRSWVVGYGRYPTWLTTVLHNYDEWLTAEERHAVRAMAEAGGAANLSDLARTTRAIIREETNDVG